MSKIFAGVLIGAALVGAVLGVFGLVNAQAPVATQQGQQPGYGMMAYSDGRMGRGGGMMGRAAEDGEIGPMHDLMIAAWAEELDLSVEDIEARLANGETLYDIALSQGLTVEEFQAARVEIHATVLDEAVAQGLITQEQADWMKSRGARMGAGTCTGGAVRGRRGSALQTNP